MKRIFSKKSGFTLVEIIIAFAVFAIMALMLVQVLNLSINQKNANQRFEKGMQEQEEVFIAKGKKWEVESTDDGSKPLNGDIKFNFIDQNDVDISADYSYQYQLKSAYGDPGELGGLHYFVADGVNYDEDLDVTWTEDGGDDSDPENPDDIGGGTQASRFDTRITGTKGISSVTIDYSYDSANDEYTFTVTVFDSGVDESIKSHSQVSLFFGEDKAGGKLATIKEIEGGTKSMDSLKYVKKCGLNGVNIHCKSDNGFGGSSVTFKVKLNEKLSSLGFGENASGNTYGIYEGYVNIFGAYAKDTKAADA